MINYAIKNILVPLDFSSASLNALHTAIEMARRHNAVIALLNILEPGAKKNGLEADKAADEKNIYAQRTRQLHLLVRAVIEKHGISCLRSVVKGEVTQSICKAASKFKADIIVMGTHGMSGYNPVAIGSNAAGLVCLEGCPVLTVPPQQKWLSFKEILFPVWPTTRAVEKYGYIKNIIRQNGAILKILGLSADFENSIQKLKSMTSQLVAHVGNDKVKTTSYFKIGKNMAAEVVKISSLFKTDLIIISATVDSTIKNMVRNSFADQIINRAKVPVLCVREPMIA